MVTAQAPRSRRSLPTMTGFVLAGGLAGAVAVTGAIDAWQEYAVRGAVEDLRKLDLAKARGDEPPVVNMENGGSIAPRALVSNALLLARTAESETNDARRSELIATAGARIDAALAARPGWGEALVVDAYRGSLDGPAGLAAARERLAQSYAAAPYLRSAGLWRVDWGLKQWAALGPATRTDLIDEAIWLMGVDPSRRSAIAERFRLSPAYAAFMQRWSVLRREREARDESLN